MFTFILAVLALHPGFAPLTSLTFTPPAVVSGNKTTGVINLSAPSSSGYYINLSTSNPAVASVPANAFVTPGATLTTFSVTATPGQLVPASTVVTATYGTSTVTQTLNIVPIGPSTVALSPTMVSGGVNSNGTVTINTIALPGGFTVNLSSDTQGVTVPASATVIYGATATTFSVSTVPVTSPVVATITATADGIYATTKLTINPPWVTGLSVSPATVSGGSPSTATVQLSGISPTGGTVVSVSSNSGNTIPPATVTVPAGASYATFTVNTLPVGANSSATLTATAGGSTKTATLNLTPPVLSGFTLSPTIVGGGSNSTGTVTLGGAAPANGFTVNLSSNAAIAQVPATVVVPSGASSATFNVTTSAVQAIGTAIISATAGTVMKTVTMTINPASLIGLTVLPSTVAGGATAVGTVSLTGNAPPGGVSIGLSSNNADAIVPATVLVPAGASTATFNVTTKQVTAKVTAVITATQSTQFVTANLIVQPISITGLSLSTSSVVGGSQTAVTGTLTFNGPTPAAGLAVTLTSSSPAACTVPATVKVTLTGTERTATFAVTPIHVSAATTVTISAKAGGTTETATLTVNPFAITGFTINPVSVAGGTPAEGTVTLNTAPGTKGGPIAVKLSEGSSAVTVPATVSVPVGATSASFKITTTGVASNTSDVITATEGSSSKTATLQLEAATLVSVTLKPTSVKGSATTVVTGTITLSGPAPTAGLTVGLASSNPNAATVPASVKVLAGKSTATFTVTHKKVTAQSTVTVTATLGAATQTGTLTVTP